MQDDPAPARQRRTVASPRLVVTLVLLGVAWVSAPVWFFVSAFESAPLFGASPTPAEEAVGALLMDVAWFCAFAAPTLGLILAAMNRQRAGAVAFGLALALSVTVGAGMGLFSSERQHDTYVPERPASTRHHCMELSGGDNECPGG